MSPSSVPGPVAAFEGEPREDLDSQWCPCFPDKLVAEEGSGAEPACNMVYANLAVYSPLAVQRQTVLSGWLES